MGFTGDSAGSAGKEEITVRPGALFTHKKHIAQIESDENKTVDSLQPPGGNVRVRLTVSNIINTPPFWLTQQRHILNGYLL